MIRLGIYYASFFGSPLIAIFSLYVFVKLIKNNNNNVALTNKSN